MLLEVIIFQVKATCENFNFQRVFNIVEQFLFPVSKVIDINDPSARFKVITEKKNTNNDEYQAKIKLGNDYLYVKERILYREDLERELMQSRFHHCSREFSSKIFKKLMSRFNFPKLMGIVNVTPDSFYPESRVSKLDELNRIYLNKPDIIDAGGESTRPGSETIKPQDEQSRLMFFFDNLPDNDIEISIDTRNPSTAELFSAKIHYINDISGFSSSMMRDVAKSGKKKCIVMHMRGTPGTMNYLTNYDDLIAEINMFFFERVGSMLDYGIEADKIIIDPGIGFSKTAEGNMKIIANAGSFSIGPDVLFGTSRKSFIGKLTGSNVQERLPETIATSLHLAMNSVDILRVHDVKENRNSLLMLEQLLL